MGNGCSMTSIFLTEIIFSLPYQICNELEIEERRKMCKLWELDEMSESHPPRQTRRIRVHDRYTAGKYTYR